MVVAAGSAVRSSSAATGGNGPGCGRSMTLSPTTVATTNATITTATFNEGPSAYRTRSRRGSIGEGSSPIGMDVKTNQEGAIGPGDCRFGPELMTMAHYLGHARTDVHARTDQRHRVAAQEVCGRR